MDTELLIKITGIGLIVCVAYQLLAKNGHEEQALFVTVSGMIIVMLMLLEKISDLLTTIRNLFGI